VTDAQGKRKSMTENTTHGNGEKWDINITAARGSLDLNLGEIWRYRDLLLLFVKKDIITVYKQTILGPLWFVVQPIFTTIVFTLLFGQMAGFSSNGIPAAAFYLLPITLWSYFSDTLNIISKTFTDNSAVFGKVYFPRLIMPLSKILSGLAKFFIQLCMFFLIWGFYVFYKHAFTPNWYLLLAPVLLLIIIVLAMACGILITSMTTKYRDLTFLVAFGMQLLMYSTPVAYSMSDPKIAKYSKYIWYNPLTSLFEGIKYGFFGKGVFNIPWMIYSTAFALVLLLLGIIIFNNVEKRFIDTV